MYNFHYGYIKQKYPDAKLCFTDTDSLTYLIQTDDIYKDMLNDHEHFDFSDYKDDHLMFNGLDADTIHYYKQKNKKVVGKMKDELKGVAPREFVGLRPKLYTLLYDGEADFDVVDGEEIEVKESTPTSIKKVVEANKQTAKGIKESVKDTHLRHEQYLTTLNELSTLNISQNLIKSERHQLHSINVNKSL